MKKNYKKIISFLALVLLIVFLFILFLFISPVELIEKVGIGNGYVLAFFVSLFGSFSSGGFALYMTVLLTLVAGGLNPIILGLITGVGQAIGDSFIYYTLSKGRGLISGKIDKKMHKATEFYNKRPWLSKLIPVLAYIYMGFTPFPNDLLLLFMAAIEYPKKKMGIIIILGDITFSLIITLLAAKGIMLI